jgi:sensor histidine kinase regulating citrate/malate metabolism
VEVLIKLNEQELIIEVADQGVGITPEIRERILSAASPPKHAAIMVLACI